MDALLQDLSPLLSPRTGDSPGSACTGQANAPRVTVAPDRSVVTQRIQQWINRHLAEWSEGEWNDFTLSLYADGCAVGLSQTQLQQIRDREKAARVKSEKVQHIETRHGIAEQTARRRAEADIGRVQQFSKTKRAAFTVFALVIVFVAVAKVFQPSSERPFDAPGPISPPQVENQVQLQVQPATKETSAEPSRVSSPASGKDWQIPGLALELAYVAPGNFQMGSNNGSSDEKPVHTVSISQGYWMGKHEVTQQQFQSITANNPSEFKGASNPVETISWTDAVSFCQRLTARERAAGRLPESLVYRLPTEAELEYAARGGNGGRVTEYAGSNSVNGVAWYNDNSGGTTHPVGQKQANELGLYDMSGNVYEWCLDACNYDSRIITDTYRDGLVDPVCGNGSYRVYRSGSWSIKASWCHVAFRNGSSPTSTYNDLGLRVVLASPLQR